MPCQCTIAAFEGLLPSQHNEIVMTLLFRLAEWHALAKLRMHTDTTLTCMEMVIAILGRELRRFRGVFNSRAPQRSSLSREEANLETG